MGKTGPKPKEIINTSWSSNLAYAIGLLSADGCLATGQYLIDLTSKDRDQLNNFSKCLGLQLKIGHKSSGRNDGTAYYRVQFKNKIFYEFLLSIGLKPAKSKTLGPLQIPKKYFFDFLRGVFDGDGSFYSYWDKRWRSSFMYYVDFISASQNFIVWLHSSLQELANVKGSLSTRKRVGVFQLKFAKKEALILINKMYSDQKVICLRRKRLKIQKALGIVV